jgi:hypothetical protein
MPLRALLARLFRPSPPVKGCVSASTPDLDGIIRMVRERVPDVEWWQLSVAHAADDDGIWFFRIPGTGHEIQILSSWATCPFEIDATHNKEQRTESTPAAVADAIVEWLSEQRTLAEGPRSERE